MGELDGWNRQCRDTLSKVVVSKYIGAGKELTFGGGIPRQSLNRKRTSGNEDDDFYRYIVLFGRSMDRWFDWLSDWSIDWRFRLICLCVLLYESLFFPIIVSLEISTLAHTHGTKYRRKKRILTCACILYFPHFTCVEDPHCAELLIL